MKLDWLLYGACVALITVVTSQWHENSPAPPAPPPPGVGEMALFANFTPFSAGSIINLPIGDQRVMTGTAFSLSQTGDWVVSRQSIRGCSHQYVPGKVVAWSHAMAKPHQRLHFAGEHVRRLEVGMESAMETGERAAIEILEKLSA